MTDTTNSSRNRNKTQDRVKTPAKGPHKHSRLQLVGEVPHEFNTDEILDFIDIVFGDTVPENAHRLVYSAPTNNPGMPSQNGVDGLETILRRTTKGRALYFNASSCYRAKDEKLRHKRDLFAAFHVLVLDDIGTKIPFDRLPKGLRKPTYIIESSAGNFQYGYVLQEPITNFDHATSLVQVAAMAGLTDGGGVMATKIVRLPGGINGKPSKEKHEFKVRAPEITERYFTPEMLLERINFEIDDEVVTWEAILNNEIKPLARKHRNHYLNLQPIAQTTDGVIDPVLEWLYTNDLVMGDSGGPWVDILCPWCDTHTTGEQTAGYAPVGRGDNTGLRGFNCFHEHCADRNIKDFIGYIIANSTFSSIPVEDNSLELFKHYIFDEPTNQVWRVGKGKPQLNKIEGFKNRYNSSVRAVTMGKNGTLGWRNMSAAQIWLESPYRVIARGAKYEPGDDAMLRDKHEELWVNMYMAPPWKPAKYSQKHVDIFTDFITYLLPSDIEADYFLMWLAAKVQDPRFRGTGIIMTTPTFGTGRSTLGTMVGELLGRWNTKTVPFNSVLDAGEFNEWESALMVIVSEAKELTGSRQKGSIYAAYEALKQRIDTTATDATVNPKYGRVYDATLCSSYLIFTNHEDTVSVPSHDRRLTVMSNPIQPESPEYFVKLNAWLDEVDQNGNKVWAQHVYSWLQTLPVDMAKLMLPLQTAARERMVDVTQSGVRAILSHLERYMLDNNIYSATPKDMRAVLDTVLYERGDHTEYTDSYITKSLNDISVTFKHFKTRKGNTSYKVRVLLRPLRNGAFDAFNEGDHLQPAKDLPELLKATIRKHVKEFNPKQAAARVLELYDD
jgi:hypothetical protein